MAILDVEGSESLMAAQMHPDDGTSSSETLGISGDAFIIADQQGRVADWSPQARRLFGWTKQEAVGQLLGNLIIPEEQRHAHWNGLARYQQTGEGRIVNRCVELTALHRNGELFPVELTVTPTRIGEQMLFCGVVRPIEQRQSHSTSSRQRVIESRLFQQATTRWANAEDFEEALKDCVEIMCTVAGWPVGHALVRDQSRKQLISADVWHFQNADDHSAIREASRLQSFSELEGFPGRIWAWLMYSDYEPFQTFAIEQDKMANPQVKF